jgi:hypothetical protein
MILHGCLVLAMVIEQAVRGHVAMDDQLGMPMLFALVHVLGRSYRQQADSQAEHACDNPGHPHA